MTIKNYTRVKLVTDAYFPSGVKSGAIGYIVEVYPDGRYEIEFSDSSGITIAQLVVNMDDVVVAE